MSADEIADLLAAGRKLQLATINSDGTPHLVTMYYALLDGRLAFWTYASSQKTRNIERDPRVTCLVESGEGYSDLRGVQIVGEARRLDDFDAVVDVGTRVARRMAGQPAEAAPEERDDGLSEYVQHSARKRVAYVVEPTRTVSWDHTKLDGGS